MKDYSYIGVIEDCTGDEERFVVRSKDHSIRKGNLVEITVGRHTFLGEVLHSAYLPIGSEEESMLAELGAIHEVEKIYGLAWEKKEEVTEDGN